MHIAVLSDPANFHTQKWARALQNAGAEVTVFSFFDAQIEGIPCVRIEPSYTLNGKLTYASYLYSTDKLYRELITHRVDLVNPINITPFGVWAARTPFRPIVSIAMGADILEYPPERKESRIPEARTWSSVEKSGPIGRAVKGAKWHFFRKHISHALERSDLITGDNLQLIHALKDWFHVPARKVRLNRWGVEEDLFETSPERIQALRKRFDIRDWQRVVLSPRGMKPVYNGDLILDAFEMLVRRGPRDVKFLMLSAGYDIPAAVLAKARELDKHFQNFTFVPEVMPREEVYELWSLVDAFISAPAYDGYSNALAEGRYAGAIPIVNAIPANLELIDHKRNGWVVDPFTPQHLADAILTIMEYKLRFGKVNRDWILLNSHLRTNVRMFLRDCKRVLTRYRQQEAAAAKRE